MTRTLWFTMWITIGCAPPPGVQQTYTVPSEHTASTYAVRTFVPEGVIDVDSAPQLIVLDGDWHALPAFVEATRSNPAPVVIAVGYHDENARMRDFTPTASDAYPGSGGVDDFVAALETEILPDLPGSANERIWFGHSAGGLAVTHLLLERPDLAASVICASPSYLWDDAVMFDRIEDRNDLGEVYLTAGGQEGHAIPALARAASEEFGEHATFTLYPAREHTDTVAPSLRDGLDHFLGGL